MVRGDRGPSMPRSTVRNRTNLAAFAVFAASFLALHQIVIKDVDAADLWWRLTRPIKPATTTTTTSSQESTPNEPDPDLLVNEGFETAKVGTGWTGIATYPRLTTLEGSDSLAIVTYPVRKGKYALKMTVQPEDAVTDEDRRLDKERCEFVRLNLCRDGVCTLGNEGREGSELWYSWSILIPTDYQYVSTTPDNYQIMGQWHDQPAPGTTATGFSPPISVHYRSTGYSQTLEFRYGLLQIGGAIKTIETPIQRGQWIDLMLHIRFSQGGGGFLEVWKNGVMLATESGATRITGPNMYNSEPNYLRLGLYRGKAQPQTNAFYYDEIKIATSRAALTR
jgi:polysaccharide lyase-like protein